MILIIGDLAKEKHGKHVGARANLNNIDYIVVRHLCYSQECRRHMYSNNNAQDSLLSEPIKKVLAMPYDVGDICRHLIDLMASEAYLDMDFWGFHMGSKRLLEEIELFFSTLNVDDDRCR